MAYTILYSDPAKNNNPIIVQDGTINVSDTSLTLVGKNYPGYGQAIETDLVHILENFAGAAPPSNPIEGQLWFDTSDPNNKRLKINDGGITNSVWAPVNGVFQQSYEPTNVKLGDIWVDTGNQQLKFFNGQSFTLVGPSYSSASRTGSYPSQLIDTLGITHDVIINYIDDTIIEVISADEFTPNPIIDGFESISVGINVLKSLGNSSIKPKVNGIADVAYNLQISIPSSQKISADSFLRNDIDQRMGGSLNISEDDNSLIIGSNPTFILERKDQYEARFINTYDSNQGGRFTFTTFKNGISNQILTLDGNNQKIGINNTKYPIAELDVNGSLNVTNSGTFDTLYVNSTLTNIDAVLGNAVQVQGGVGIAGTLSVSGEHILVGPLVIGSEPRATATNVQSVILPAQDYLTKKYDIGDPAVRWSTIYANVFTAGPNSKATFDGNAESATYLSKASPVYIQGDGLATGSIIGNGISVNLNLTLQSASFTSKSAVATTTGTDLLLACTNVTSNPQLRKQTKRDFLRDINYYDSIDQTANVGYTTPSGSLVPIGTIMPYAGSVAPPGWLLCDGSPLTISNSNYQNLITLIGKKYDPTNQGFLLPNLINRLTTNDAVPINYIIKY